jgi:biotin transporter BioY
MSQKRKMRWKSRILLATFIGTAILFLPTTILLFVAMLPTVTARVMDHTREHTKVLTVGFMNFAGCFPFLYSLFETGHKIDNALAILADPLTIVTVYSCAMAGYILEWIVTTFVAGLMVQKGRRRLEIIKKIQDSLVKQWGTEVTGELQLDPYGFPVEPK